MRRTLIILWQTYWGAVTQRSFLLFVLGLPVLAVGCAVIFGLAGALFIRVSLPPTNGRPVGLVDESRTAALADSSTYPTNPVPLQRYESVTAARSALQEGVIQAYFVVSADYWETGNVTAAYDPNTPPSPSITNMVERWLRQRVRQAIDPDLLARYEQEPTFIPHGVQENPATEAPPRTRQQEMDTWVVFLGIIYLGRMASMLTSGYMYDIIASESRNRTMEILLTSANVREFIVGRVLGLLGVGITHLLVWGSLPVFLLAAAGNSGPLGELLQWEYFGLMISLLIGGYLLDQLLGAAGGVLRVTGGAGPQLFNIIGWLSIITLVYAGYFVPRAPDSITAVIATFIPISAPIVLLTRLLSGPVPLWQIVLAQLLLWSSLVALLLAIGRLLRRNLVAYPSRFSLRQWAKKQLAMNNEQ